MKLLPRRLLAVAPLAALLAINPSCKNEPKKAEAEAEAKPKADDAKKAHAAEKAKAKPKPKFKPLEWEDPKEWKRVEPSSRMRRASYEIPAAAGDTQAGELNVFILGGEIEPNIKRWVDEFKNVDVKDIVRVDRTVNDVTQAVVEIPKGDFSGGMGSMEGGKGYGLLGAIAVAPSGAKYFFKLTGPEKTIKAARDPFYRLLDSLRVEGSGAGAKPAENAAKAPGAKPAGASEGKPPASPH
jgi:hypothetical protein